MKMKNTIFGIWILIVITSASSCKNEYDEAIEDEEIKIKKYLKENNLTTELTESGLYYIEIEQGSGEQVNKDDFISISVVGDVIENNLDTSYSNVTFIVGSNQMIEGLDEGVQLMKEQGKARFIIPFELAYYSPDAYSPNYNTFLFEIKIDDIIENPLAWELERINKYIQDSSLDVVPDTSGFCFLSIEEGTGEFAEEGDYIEIIYVGALLDGTIFDQSHANEETALNINLESDRLIKGWIKGITMMKEGGRALFIVPSSLAYGSEYIGPHITPYSTLLFEVKLLNVI